MERTCAISGVCGQWRLTVGLDPEDDTEYTADPLEAKAALALLEQHFQTIVNLLEVQTLWADADRNRRW